ncbi:MAG: double-strand break repair protein AddB [Methylocystaceae bacterium]|nr:MAG: double-strand break repair protein AddB [Methylocystaceae bacterium]
MAPRNVFSIPPGVPFLAAFTRALLDGEIVAGLTRESGPLALAETTIYVPTQRAGRALAAQFAAAIDAPAALLPRILPLGGLDEQETSALFHGDLDDGGLDDALAPAIEEIDRRLVLAELVLQWARALRHAIVSIDPTGRVEHDAREALLVAISPASAYALAGDLCGLIDEFVIEGVDARALNGLSDESYDRFWAITTNFLQIALQDWPNILAERGRIDRAARQAALIGAQISHLQGGGARGPVVALGSTGANPATARLLATIARLARGAVVLPGLDFGMAEDAWRRIGHAGGDKEEPAFTHPQTMLKRLLSIIGVAREEARRIGAPAPELRARTELLAEALRPADTTDAWRDYRAARGAVLGDALQGVAFVEAADEREEALALALFMREALETPGRTAALITPDRDIARRVSAELARWGIEIDDSGGRPLAMTPIGALARLVAAIAEDGASAVDVAALLAHPQARFGLEREQVERLAPLVEIAVLRGVERGAGGWSASAAAARDIAARPHAYPALQRLADTDWEAIDDLLARMDAATAPLATLSPAASLATRTRAHAAAIEAIVGATPGGEGAPELLSLFDALAGANSALVFDAGAYASLFDRLSFETIVRGPRRAHPRLKILGLLEARLLDADLALLAGLDETIWPPQADSGAFLNRSMRRQLGLSPPERRIGQTAHDFTMAFGAREVVVSRARKRAGAPTVASRFVTRLAALAGDAFLRCKQRGDEKLTLAIALDRPVKRQTIGRPLPRPPVELRPATLSVTRIETLRRDPYAIFAEQILRLVALPPLGAEKGAREIGVAIHAALAAFQRAHPLGPLPEDARERLISYAREALDGFLADPGFLAFDWPRIEAGLDHALAFERERRETASGIFVEIFGAWNFPLGDGSAFTLKGVADRIEIGENGAVAVFDYKTGTPPTAAQVGAGFSPQLTLEAAMLEAGAFQAVGKKPVEAAAYVRLSGKNGGQTQWLAWKDKSFADVVADHRAQLLVLLDQFRDANTPYPSRPFVAFASRYGDYDHLARVKEWSRDGGGDGE